MDRAEVKEMVQVLAHSNRNLNDRNNTAGKVIIDLAGCASCIPITYFNSINQKIVSWIILQVSQLF